MFCTIKFVYYKSFCVRDDIGSYIRTVYHMVSHTPKRKAVGSNPAGDAKKESRTSVWLSFFGLFIINYVLFNLLKIRFSIRDKREEREIPGRKAAEKNKPF